MTSSVKIEITAIDNAIATLNKVRGELKQTAQQAEKVGKGGAGGLQSFGKSLGDMKSAALGVVAPIAGVGAAVAGVSKFVMGSVNDWVAYNQEIRKLSIAAGAAPEDLSRMMQAADDLGVSMDALGAAFAYASRNGVTPTISNIAALSDKLLAIKDPTKRAEEAVKIFGRGWAEVAPFILAGSDAIKAGTAAIADGMVVTQESIAATEEYRVAVDNLSDSWTELKNRLAMGIIPTLTEMVDITNVNLDNAKAYTWAFKEILPALKEGEISFKAFNNILVKVSADMMDLREAQQYVNYEMAVAKEGYYRAGAQLVLMNRVTQDTTTSTEGLGNSVAGAAAEASRLAASAKQAEISLDRLKRSEDLKFRLSFEFPTNDIDAQIKSWFDASKWEASMGPAIETISEQIQAGIAAGTITKEQADGMFEQVFLASQAVQMELGLIDANEAANNIQNTLGKSLNDAWDIVKKIRKDANFTAEAVINIRTQYFGINAPKYYNPKREDLGLRAAGGPVEKDNYYLVGERGPEIFVPDRPGTIIPNNGNGMSGNVAFGGNVYLGGINIYTQPGQSAEQIAQAVITQINRATRLNRTAGLGYTT